MCSRYSAGSVRAAGCPRISPPGLHDPPIQPQTRAHERAPRAHPPPTPTVTPLSIFAWQRQARVHRQGPATGKAAFQGGRATGSLPTRRPSHGARARLAAATLPPTNNPTTPTTFPPRGGAPTLRCGQWRREVTGGGCQRRWPPHSRPHDSRCAAPPTRCITPSPGGVATRVRYGGRRQ